MGKKRRITYVAAALLSVVLFIGAAKPDLYFIIKKNFTIFSEVYREVAINYVDEVDPQKLMRKGINAMLASLDPYTVFIDEADKQNIDIITQGSYSGVGLNVGIRDGKMVVISPIEGYSAYKKGIRAGDIIISINGISVENQTPEEVENLTTGEPGSTVTITVKRYAEDRELTFELERERIEIKNIDYAGFLDPENTIGYISLNRFSQHAADEMQQAFEKLQQQHPLKGLVIDVRNNPGGLLREAVGIVDMFVDAGQKVVETRGRMENKNEVFKTSKPALAPDLPIVLLQNNGSASASEILSGALQDVDRAVIMGTQSFGKGLVQIIRPLSYNTALKITTARYYIPSGRSIQAVTYGHDAGNAAVKKPDSLRRSFKTKHGRTVFDGEGITPDIKVEAESLTILEASLLQQSQFFLFANQYVAEHDTYPYDELSNKVFEAFKTFLKEHHFTYQTPAEEHLIKVKKGLETQGNYSFEIASNIEDLQTAINQEKARALNEQKVTLKKLLHIELLGRYKGREIQNAVSLRFDLLVNRAINVLKDGKQYKFLLSGSH